jgi:multiple sugar transport system permease protein
MTRETLPARIAKAVAIIWILVWSLLPIVIGFVTSISSQTDVRAVPARWVPHTFTLDSYRQLLGGTDTQHAGGTVTEAGVYQHALLASSEVALMATALTLVVATMAAYAFGRLRFRLGRMLFVAVLSTMLVPVFVVAVTLFQVMADFHLIDTLVFVATLTPLATWLLYNHVREMDVGPEEAALVDGCRRWQAFWRVVVPQMGSAIAAIAAITALTVWGEFLIPLLLTSTSNSKPVTVLITEYVGKYTTNYPIVAAAGVLALLPPAILALLLNRRITSVMAGSS